MELNTSFLSGLGCGVCVGISLLTIKKFHKAIKVYRKYSSTSGCKLVFVVRTDLNMTKGKIAAQCAHAAVGTYKEAQTTNPELLQAWELTGQPKIALKTESIDELLRIADNAEKLGLVTSLIRDDGRTQIPRNTVTVLGVGPAPSDIINKVTGHLRLL